MGVRKTVAQTGMPGLRKSVALVGIMGAGKTAVGRELARLAHAPFHDSDHEVEAAAGMTVPDIFSIYGEGEFRALERRVITRLLGVGPIILATGGGAYIQAETRALLDSGAATVWLSASLETVFERVRYRGGRPLLAGEDPRAALAGLIHDRDPVYAKARIKIESDGDSTPEHVARDVTACLRREGFLEGQDEA